MFPLHPNMPARHRTPCYDRLHPERAKQRKPRHTRLDPFQPTAQSCAKTKTQSSGRSPMIRIKTASWLAMAFACALSTSARAEQIAVGNFGVSANGMPFAVALDKGFFTAEGIKVDGIITSAGGGTSLRNMIAGGVPYGEVNPGVVVAAIMQGADLRIISDNVLTVAEFVWAVKPDSPIKTLADIKGKKVGYTNPRSTSQALAQMVAQKAGLQPSDIELVRTGGFGEGYAALGTGMIDVAPIPEPLWAQYKDKLRAIAYASEILPPLSNVVGVTTANMAAEKGEFIRAVIRARRKAVEFMIANPDEAGDIVAKHYNLTPAVARSAVRNLVTSKTQGVEYWGSGQINMEGLRRMIDVQKSLGAIQGDADVTKMVDTQFLPEDIRKPK
ncbi:MAG: ABC transporter substrate-binding protein [Beijerinckiaceae bacterium]|nr:ABC transporter substrate-binding protein [Beijerinckiaceae bacterium]